MSRTYLGWWGGKPLATLTSSVTINLCGHGNHKVLSSRDTWKLILRKSQWNKMLPGTWLHFTIERRYWVNTSNSKMRQTEVCHSKFKKKTPHLSVLHWSVAQEDCKRSRVTGYFRSNSTRAYQHFRAVVLHDTDLRTALKGKIREEPRELHAYEWDNITLSRVNPVWWEACVVILNHIWQNECWNNEMKSCFCYAFSP